MQYKGKLYANVSGKYVPLDVTTTDIDELVSAAQKLVEMVRAPVVLNEKEFLKELDEVSGKVQGLINKVK